MMDISSSTGAPTDIGSAQVEVLKKSIEVSERAALKVLESAAEQSQATTAQKTGIGTHLNIKG